MIADKTENIRKIKTGRLKRIIAAAMAAAAATLSVPAAAEEPPLYETEETVLFETEPYEDYLLIAETAETEEPFSGDGEAYEETEADAPAEIFDPILIEDEPLGETAFEGSDSEETFPDEESGSEDGIEIIQASEDAESAQGEEEAQDAVVILEEAETDEDVLEEDPFYEETDVSGEVGFAEGGESGSAGSARRLRSGGAQSFTNYGDQLSENERATYDALESNWLGGSTERFDVILRTPLSFTISGEADDAYVNNREYRNEPEYAECKQMIRRYVQAGLDAFIYDHPEAFWFSKVNFAYETLSRESGSYSENEDGSTTLTIRKFSVTSPYLLWSDAPSQVPAFQSAVEAAVDDASSLIPEGASAGRKARILSEYIGNVCIYEEGTYSHTAFGVFCGGGKAVCEGYAKAFKILCGRFGVECALVPGDLNVNGRLEPHMWTAVKTDDGLWRIADPTLNDSSKDKTEYMLVGADAAAGKRTAYDSFSETDYSRTFTTPPIAADACHEEIETFRKDPTCEEDGRLVTECALHDGEEIEEILPALGHSFSDWRTVRETGCEEDGIQERECSVCGEKEERTVPATGHSFSDWKTETPATCEKDGMLKKTCASCGKKETKTVSATGIHVPSDWEVVKPATCSDEGIRIRKCAQCGKETDRETIPKKTYCSPGDWETIKPATCAESGIRIRKCSVCGKETDRQTVPKTGVHSFEAWRTTVPASCETAGTAERTCSVCGKTETKTVPATGGHAPSEWKTTKEATCAETGVRIRTCAKCGKETDREVIPKTTVHSPSSWRTTKEATCAEAGVQVKTCLKCGAEVEKKQIPALGHSYSEWTDSSRATIKKSGTQVRTCRRCGAKETRTTAKLKPFAKFSAKSLSLTKGQKSRIAVSYAYGDAVKSWKSSAKSVATVSKNGTVKTVKAGKCVVTVVMKSGKKASVKVTVKNPKTEGLKISAKGLKNGKATIRKGKTLRLNVKRVPSNATDKIRFSTSSKKIATVSGNGLVKGKRKGTARITVKAGSATAVVVITVR